MKLSDIEIAQAAHNLTINERLSKLVCDKYKWDNLDNEHAALIERFVDMIRTPPSGKTTELFASRYGYCLEAWLKMFRDDIGLIDAREMHARFEQIVNSLDKVN